MKKRIAMIMTAMLTAAAIAPCAYAEAETEAVPGTSLDNPIMFDYHDMDPDVYEGAWVSTGLGFDLYLPADWVLTDISEEEAAAGLVFRAGEEGGGANVCLTCTAIPEEVADTLDYDMLKAELDANVSESFFLDLNGIPAIGYDSEESKTSGFSILPGDGTLISGVVAPPSDEEYEDFAPYFQNIFMSVSPTETAETEAAE